MRDVAVLADVASAMIFWRQQAEHMERQRNEAFAEHGALAARVAEAEQRRDELAVENAALRALLTDHCAQGHDFLGRLHRYLDRPADQRGAEILAAGNALAAVIRSWGPCERGDCAPIRRALDRWHAGLAPTTGDGGAGAC